MDNNITLFNNVKLPDSEKKEVSVSFFLNGIKHGMWQDVVLNVRAGKIAKVKAPVVTASGTFTRRAAKNLVQHSGYICMDFDAQDNVDLESKIDELKADEYSAAVFRSISGKGIAVFVKIERNYHDLAFRQLANYYTKEHKLIADHSGKDVSRARFVSYDPEIYINEKSTLFKVEKSKSKKPKQAVQQYFTPESSVERLLNEIISTNLDITSDYLDWINVGFALKSHYGDQGLEKWKAVSAMSANYNGDACDRKWKSLKDSGGITISTLFHLAFANGLTLDRKRETDIEKLYQATGGKADKIDEHLKNSLGVKGLTDEEKKALKNYNPPKGAPGGKDDELPDVVKARIWLSSNVETYRCAITKLLMEGNKHFTEVRLNDIWVTLKSSGINLRKSEVYDIINSAFSPERNLVEEFLIKHRTEGTDEIDKMLDGMNLDNPDAKPFVVMWMASVLETLFNEPMPYYLVLTGEQNTGKTEFFRRIFPPSLRRFVNQDIGQKDKDYQATLVTSLVLLDDEFKNTTNRDVAHLKSVLSTKTFMYRPVWARVAEPVKRIASFCGTSNEDDVLLDFTGNRRIFPVKVNQMNFDILDSVDRTKLWGQIYNLWLEPEFNINISVELMKTLKDIGDVHTYIPKEEDWIAERLEPNPEGRMSMNEVIGLLQTANITRNNITTNLVGGIFRKLGFKDTRVRVNGRMGRYWKISWKIGREPISTSDDIAK